MIRSSWMLSIKNWCQAPAFFLWHKTLNGNNLYFQYIIEYAILSSDIDILDIPMQIKCRLCSGNLKHHEGGSPFHKPRPNLATWQVSAWTPWMCYMGTSELKRSLNGKCEPDPSPLHTSLQSQVPQQIRPQKWSHMSCTVNVQTSAMLQLLKRQEPVEI